MSVEKRKIKDCQNLIQYKKWKTMIKSFEINSICDTKTSLKKPRIGIFNEQTTFEYYHGIELLASFYEDRTIGRLERFIGHW